MLAFVLGGGGSRGALQLGALEVLFKAGIQPEMLIGTSVGSLNATFLAHNPTLAGIEALKQIWFEVRGEDVYPGSSRTAVWNMIRGRASLYNNDSWRQLIERCIPVATFGELNLPAYAVSTDIDTGGAVVYGDRPQDRLLDGLMGSTAVLPAHPFWEANGRRLADGAYAAALPIRQAMERGATQIVAFNLMGQLTKVEEISNSLAMMNHSIDLLTRQQIASDIAYARMYPHVEIQVLDLKANNYVFGADFSRTAELMDIGRAIGQQALQTGVLSEWRGTQLESAPKQAEPLPFSSATFA